LAEVETKMERHFLVEYMRKPKFMFPTNTLFSFYGCFT
jgi:hypothetical protein